MQRGSTRIFLGTNISIHAPYKGCNVLANPTFPSAEISIHAPYKGCNFTCLEK